MDNDERGRLVISVRAWAAVLIRARLGRRTNDFDDLLQDAMVQLLKAAETFDPARGKPSTWCSAVVSNFLNTQQARARRAIPVAPLGDVSPADPSQPTPEAAASRVEEAARLRAALARLGRADRELLEKVAYDDMPIAHADRSVSRQAATGRYKTAVKRAKRLLAAKS